MAVITNEEINNIRSKANIVDIIGSYLPLTQRGRNYLCVCPFHDDHSPSMSVSEEKQIYKCFACGNTGNVFTFVENYEDVSFLDAVMIVAEKCGISIDKSLIKNNKVVSNKEEFEIMNLAEKFYQNNLKTEFGTTALDYLNKRGISEEFIKEFGIGLSLDNSNTLYNLLLKKKYNVGKLLDVGIINQSDDRYYDMFTRRITFPLWDKDGNVVGFSARIYRGEKDTSKYVNSRESKLFKKGETLYNYHRARDFVKLEKSVIVVEGFMDAIRLFVGGVKNVVALQGTALTKEQINLLKKLHSKVILCLDNDSAGENATLSNGEAMIKEGLEVYVIRLSGQKDPDEYVLANGIEAFKNNLVNPMTYFDFKVNYLKKNRDLSKTNDLAMYVNQVLEEVANSKDDILIELTLKKISEEYNLSLEVLKEKVKGLKKVNSQDIKTVKKDNKLKKDAYMLSSDKIIYFMLNGGEYIDEYQKKLGFFDDAMHREIANEIIYYYQKNNDINPPDFITYVSDKETIRDNVMQIVSDGIDDDVSIEIMDGYIARVDELMVKNEIKRLKIELKNETDASKKIEILERITELKKSD